MHVGLKFCCSLLIILPLAALAQGQSTSLGGAVVDRLETPVTSAKLTLTNPQTGAALIETSTPSGGYLFSVVAPGSYDLSVAADGFKLYTRHGVDVGATPASLDIRLDRDKADPTTIKELQSLATSKPGDPQAHFNLGRAYSANGETEKALHEIQKSLKLKQDYLAARVALAQLALRASVPSFTLQSARQLLETKPGSGLAAILAAQAYERLGQADDAAEFLERFLNNNPNDSEVLVEMGYVNLQRKQYAEAGKALARAYSMDPSNVRGLRGLAEIHLQNKEPEKAVQVVAAEVEKYPQRLELRSELAAAEFRAGQMDKAVAEYRSILDRQSDSPKEQALTYSYLGAAYESKEDLPHAIESLKKAIELAPDTPQYITSLANAYDLSGKPQDALAAYQKALKLDPGNAMAMNNAAFILVKTGGDVDEALRLVQMARRQFPDSEAVLDTLGWIYLKKDMVDSASQIFQDLIEKTNTNPTYHYHYAMVLSKKGDKAGALRELDAAMQNHPNKTEEVEIKELIKKLS